MIKSKKDILKKVIFRDCSVCVYHGTKGCPNSKLCFSTEHKPYFVPVSHAIEKTLGKLDWEVFGGKTLEVRLLWMRQSSGDSLQLVRGAWCRNGENNVHCSNCGIIRNKKTQFAWEYCPHCGSKMDLDD